MVWIGHHGVRTVDTLYSPFTSSAELFNDAAVMSGAGKRCCHVWRWYSWGIKRIVWSLVGS